MRAIHFNNHGIDPALRQKNLLRLFLASIFDEEGVAFQKIDYIFCTDEYLLKLNQQYLNHDTLTDVITFTLSETSLPVISEIYISYERVQENSVTLKIAVLEELYRVMIHGILHLCGYSDHTAKLKAEIREKEDYYLKKLKNFQ